MGVIAIAAWASAIASIAVFEDWENFVFDRQMRGESASLAEYAVEKKNRISETVRVWLEIPAAPARPRLPITIPSIASTRNRRPSIGRDGLIGRIMIPRLHLTGIVREGADEQTLRLALGHIPGTALPGQNGNIGIAGHRDTLFRGLRKIKKNDLIRFETFAGNYVYQVEGTEIVKPRDVSVLNVREHPEITLVTCYPFYYIGSAPYRFIVNARLVTIDQKEQQVGPQATGEQPVNHASEARERPEPYETTAVRNSELNSLARTAHSQTGNDIDKVTFEISTHHSQRLSAGISLGVTMTDIRHRRLSGWIWMMPDRRTIWLRDHSAREPVIFYGSMDGKQHKLVITSITRNSVKGYLLQPKNRTNRTARAPSA
jgi:sortase A